jgi:hypothetical protein
MDEQENDHPPQEADATIQPQQIVDRQDGKIVLATRLLVGLLASGSGELVQRLEELQADVIADAELHRRDHAAQPGISRDALRYLALALLLRGERSLANSIREGARGGRNLSMGTMRWAARTLDRLTDNPLGRPLRRPIAARARQWDRQIALLIKEGEFEEQASRVLAEESMGLLVDQVVDIVTENPELDRLIGELVGRKSVGLATVMADNTRTLTATADDVADGMLRKLLRRKSRRELPPSPLQGKSQTMYSASVLVKGGDSDGE